MQTLIATLSKSKTMSKAIAERLADSKSTKRQIEESRERYRPVAVRGSLLYFTVAELCRVDVMYQYSLDYFQVQRDLRCKYPPLTIPLGYDWQEVPRVAKLSCCVALGVAFSDRSEGRGNYTFEYPPNIEKIAVCVSTRPTWPKYTQDLPAKRLALENPLPTLP